MKFATEAELVQTFLDWAQSERFPWESEGAVREFSYPDGRIDVLIGVADGSVIAFEAKLTDWRRALHQAYKNTALADLSFIVVPEATAVRALAFRHKFQALGVGICSASACGIVVHEMPEAAEPLLPWLYNRARAAVRGEGAAGSVAD